MSKKQSRLAHVDDVIRGEERGKYDNRPDIGITTSFSCQGRLVFLRHHDFPLIDINLKQNDSKDDIQKKHLSCNIA